MAVALATLAACGGDDGEGRQGASRQTTTSTQATPTSTGGMPTTGPGAEAPATTPGAGGTGSASGGTSARRRAATNVPTTTGRQTGAGGAGGTGRDSTASGVAATRPGRYRYTSTGTFSFGAGGEQPRSGESVLTVDPPAGSDQHSLRQGVNRSTEQVLRHQPDGIYIVYLKVREQGLTKEFRPSSPVLAFPFGAAAGRSWSWRMTSADGQTTVEANFRIEGSESVTVGPESLPAVVVRATLSTSGDLTSQAVQTLWVAEAHRLVVREESFTDGTFGAISFHSTSKDQLLSLKPS